MDNDIKAEIREALEAILPDLDLIKYNGNQLIAWNNYDAYRRLVIETLGKDAAIYHGKTHTFIDIPIKPIEPIDKRVSKAETLRVMRSYAGDAYIKDLVDRIEKYGVGE